MADIATMSRTKLAHAYAAAKSTLKNIRAAAEEGVVRSTVLAGNVVGGGITGFVVGRAARDGKDITIGDSALNWTVVVNAVLGFGGAFGGRLLGNTLANAALGLGGGGLGYEAGAWGYNRGQQPST
jgi:hypothetical protein